MQQQQHSQVARVARPTSSHSHHFLDSSLLVPAKSVTLKLGVGAKAAEGAKAGPEGLLLLPLLAGMPSMEADTLPPFWLCKAADPEEREFGAKAAPGTNTGPVRPPAAVLAPPAGELSARPPSMEAKLLPELLLPERVVTPGGAAAPEAAEPAAEA